MRKVTNLGWLITRSVRIDLAYTSPGHGHVTRVQLFLKESYTISGYFWFNVHFLECRSFEAQKSAGNFDNWETEKEALMSHCPQWECFIEC